MTYDIKRSIFRSYSHLLETILEHGESVEDTRISATRELRGATFSFLPGDTVSRPGYSSRLAWLELLHLLAGTFDQEHFKLVAPKVKEGFFTANMAYGPRVQPHLAKLSDMLIADPGCRRAEVLIANNDFDNDKLPPPCTTSIHFLQRGGKLLTFVEMRSWDAWLGLPYDIVMFGGLALAMAAATDLTPGAVEVHASSLHLYERQFGVDTSACHTVQNAYALDLELVAAEQAEDKDFWTALQVVAQRDLDEVPWTGAVVAAEGFPLLIKRGF